MLSIAILVEARAEVSQRHQDGCSESLRSGRPYPNFTDSDTTLDRGLFRTRLRPILQRLLQDIAYATPAGNFDGREPSGQIQTLLSLGWSPDEIASSIQVDAKLVDRFDRDLRQIITRADVRLVSAKAISRYILRLDTLSPVPYGIADSNVRRQWIRLFDESFLQVTKTALLFGLVGLSDSTVALITKQTQTNVTEQLRLFLERALPGESNGQEMKDTNIASPPQPKEEFEPQPASPADLQDEEQVESPPMVDMHDSNRVLHSFASLQRRFRIDRKVRTELLASPSLSPYEKSMSVLEPLDQKILWYYLVAKKSFREIAQLVGLTTTPVYNRLQKVLQTIRLPPDLVTAILNTKILFDVSVSSTLFENLRSLRGKPKQIDIATLPQPTAEVRDLVKLINKLPAEDRELLLLYEVSGESYNSIASLKNSDYSSVRRRIVRIREELGITEEQGLRTKPVVEQNHPDHVRLLLLLLKYQFEKLRGSEEMSAPLIKWQEPERNPSDWWSLPSSHRHHLSSAANAINRLTDKQRWYLFAHYVYGWSKKRISDAQSSGQSTVSVSLARAESAVGITEMREDSPEVARALIDLIAIRVGRDPHLILEICRSGVVLAGILRGDELRRFEFNLWAFNQLPTQQRIIYLMVHVAKLQLTAASALAEISDHEEDHIRRAEIAMGLRSTSGSNDFFRHLQQKYEEAGHPEITGIETVEISNQPKNDSQWHELTAQAAYRWKQLTENINALPSDLRKILFLRFVAKMRVDEIAVLFGLSQSMTSGLITKATAEAQIGEVEVSYKNKRIEPLTATAVVQIYSHLKSIYSQNQFNLTNLQSIQCNEMNLNQSTESTWLIDCSQPEARLFVERFRSLTRAQQQVLFHFEVARQSLAEIQQSWGATENRILSQLLSARTRMGIPRLRPSARKM